ncbi:hypothetical protein Y032_0002g1073 [Ancylostoma ceylanicum]|uniref:DUF4440 domain-containing protein n=1 Tax=Ancylostoma ceylanicum TaxID=53326 RepID=A0A016W147_9BILA|nr:hypothetical protein Y032_0002g1073 [Ancylostoma ceylanicum]
MDTVQSYRKKYLTSNPKLLYKSSQPIYTSEARSTLKPIFDKYCKAIDEQQWNKDSILRAKLKELYPSFQAASFYDADAVLIQTGKKCVYGREAIKQELEKIENLMGKTTTKVSGEDYQMTTEFIILNVNFDTSTDKMGVVKGKTTQIWRKRNDTYLIYHEEFSFT